MCKIESYKEHLKYRKAFLTQIADLFFYNDVLPEQKELDKRCFKLAQKHRLWNTKNMIVKN